MLRQILRREFVPRALKTGVQSRATFAQRPDGAFNLFFPLADVRIYLSLVGKIESDRPVHLFQA